MAEQRKHRSQRDKSGKKSVILLCSDPVSQLRRDSDQLVDFTLSTNKKRAIWQSTFGRTLCNVILQRDHQYKTDAVYRHESGFTVAGTVPSVTLLFISFLQHQNQSNTVTFATTTILLILLLLPPLTPLLQQHLLLSVLVGLLQLQLLLMLQLLLHHLINVPLFMLYDLIKHRVSACVWDIIVPCLLLLQLLQWWRKHSAPLLKG